MIRRAREYFENGLSEDIITSCLNEHLKKIPRLKKLEDYYKGNHIIKKRIVEGVCAPNNKLVNNYAKYITDVLSGHLTGNAISYTSDEDLKIIIDIANKIGLDAHDAGLEKTLSIYGTGYEIVYMNEGTDIKITTLDPKTTFVVYDETVECNSLFAINYMITNDEQGQFKGYYINVYTAENIITYFSNNLDRLEYIKEEPHIFERVPITQFLNNDEEMGDFEGVISLIDAYNVLQSDRINDKERFVDAILLLTGADLEDENTLKHLKDNRVMSLPEGARAEYLAKTLDESQTQVLSNAVKEDIHKFSHTPDFSDEKFSGNASGVAMEFKLLSMENLCKIKERLFKKGIRRRLKLIGKFASIKGGKEIDTSLIEITMSRTLPVNDLELAQTLNNLTDLVASETLLAQLPFVKDPKKECEKLKKEKAENENNLLNKMAEPSFNKIGG
ncbi:MAG: phage portal protein [Eubacteriales bacterium]|nr:phage portal protein [Eubacteriales bacterium]